MCGLFGFINYGKQISSRDLTDICNALARESEERGSHATGIAYSLNGNIAVNKAPKPAHKIQFTIKNGISAVMGHTRFSTQGSERKNYNNHPFTGYANKKQFALAHNGVLWNDRQLRSSFKLPRTKIETDSYVAVQLIEHKNKLNTNSLKFMAEHVEGSFTFTVLDEESNLYIIKGDSPLSMLHFRKLGLYVYASTDSILYRAVSKTMLLSHIKHAIDGDTLVQSVDIADGSIIKIDTSGKLTRTEFKYDEMGGYGFNWFDCGISKKLSSDEEEYIEALRMAATDLGYDPDEINSLYENRFSLDEIEDFLYCDSEYIGGDTYEDAYINRKYDKR